jgi:mRNA-degrading endonuclease YafQ of YafQ-DinJ toxin-antitoxin module
VSLEKHFFKDMKKALTIGKIIICDKIKEIIEQLEKE